MQEPVINYISCCGFFCAACKEHIKGFCKGCRLGYETNEREISKAKCRIKVCCLVVKGYSTCSECSDFQDCKIILSRFKQGSYNNKKCIECLSFIKQNGYEEYFKKAEYWKNHYGKF